MWHSSEAWDVLCARRVRTMRLSCVLNPPLFLCKDGYSEILFCVANF